MRKKEVVSRSLQSRLTDTQADICWFRHWSPCRVFLCVIDVLLLRWVFFNMSIGLLTAFLSQWPWRHGFLDLRAFQRKKSTLCGFITDACICMLWEAVDSGHLRHLTDHWEKEPEKREKNKQVSGLVREACQGSSCYALPVAASLVFLSKPSFGNWNRGRNSLSFRRQCIGVSMDISCHASIKR